MWSAIAVIALIIEASVNLYASASSFSVISFLAFLSFQHCSPQEVPEHLSTVFEATDSEILRRDRFPDTSSDIFYSGPYDFAWYEYDKGNRADKWGNAYVQAGYYNLDQSKQAMHYTKWPMGEN
jgi:hypothetical protein